MLKIRLKRQGRKKRPFYRIVLTDSRNRRDGKPLEELGFYNPIDKKLRLDKARAEDWITKGAQVSDTAKWLLGQANTSGEVIQLEIKKAERLSKKAQAKQAEEESAKKQAEEEAKQAKAEEAAAEEAPAEEPAAEEAPAATEDTPADESPADESKEEKAEA